MGLVIHCNGAADDLKTHNLCQIDDVNSGRVLWGNADLVMHILP